MDDPVQDIHEVVHALTGRPPREQAEAIDRYFTPTAAFVHPFCRVGNRTGSRQFIHYIFRWYKVMSPKIQLQINSVAFDEQNLILYVNMTQVFAIWFVPTHRAKVTLTTLLKLEKSDRKYYITSQEDLYQTDQFVKFVFPWGGQHLVLLWHFIATLFCAFFAIIFTPFTILMQLLADRQQNVEKLKQQAQQQKEESSLTNGKPIHEQAKDQAKNLADKAKEQGEKLRDRVES